MIDTVIILAAGRGMRLRPWTDSAPKGMIPLHGHPLLQWQIAAIRAVGIKKIIIVRGYKAETICFPDVTYVNNAEFDKTNMVRSLLCAKEHFGNGFVAAYSDIVYTPYTLRQLIASPFDSTVTVDTSWLDYWRMRFANPLSDAESLRLSGTTVLEIGQVAKDVSEIAGQFMGLVAFQYDGIEQFLAACRAADDLQRRGMRLRGCSRDFDQLYTTDILQELVARGTPPEALKVEGGWLEVDSIADHALAEQLSYRDGNALVITR